MSGRPDNVLRRALGALGAGLYRAGLARAVVRLSPRRTRALLYHAVEPESTSFTAGLGVTVPPATFAAHMDCVRRLYDVVAPGRLGAAGDGPDGRARRRPRLVVTFDDGYASVYRHAYPILAERGLPACVYLIERAVNGHLVWVNLLNHALIEHPAEALEALRAFDPALAGLESRERIIARVQDVYEPARVTALCAALLDAVPAPAAHRTRALFASPDQVRRMRAGGIEFGFHTVDHYNLARCDDAELERQLDASGLADLLDSDTLAYPFGHYDARAAARAHRAVGGAVMTVGNNNDRYGARHLDRVEVFSPDPARLFAALEVVEPVVAWLRRRAGRLPPTTHGDHRRRGGPRGAAAAREAVPCETGPEPVRQTP